MENKIKLMLGEYAFTIAALQQQIENLNKEIDQLKTENNLKHKQKENK